MTESKKEIATKEKDLKNVKVLLKIKENVEKTIKDTDAITLEIDQLDESLKLFTSKKLIKEATNNGFKKINKEWGDLKKLTKDTNKEIAGHVSHENDRNNQNIKKLEESITQFT
jgi:hypothetical protein